MEKMRMLKMNKWQLEQNLANLDIAKNFHTKNKRSYKKFISQKQKQIKQEWKNIENYKKHIDGDITPFEFWEKNYQNCQEQFDYYGGYGDFLYEHKLWIERLKEIIESIKKTIEYHKQAIKRYDKIVQQSKQYVEDSKIAIQKIKTKCSLNDNIFLVLQKQFPFYKLVG